MGFNEPDNINQSNISVDDAVKSWPLIALKSSQIASPAISGNILKDNN